MISIYNTIEELPKCNCGCDDRMHVDLDYLDQYSTELLQLMLKEIERVMEQYQGIFGCPAPTCDIDAQENWSRARDQMMQQYVEPFMKISTELKKRIAPADLPEFAYALGKLFEELLSREKQQKENKHEN